MLSDGVVKDDRLVPFLVVGQVANQHFGEGELGPKTKRSSVPAFWVNSFHFRMPLQGALLPPWRADVKVKAKVSMSLESPLSGSHTGAVYSFFGEHVWSRTPGASAVRLHGSDRKTIGADFSLLLVSQRKYSLLKVRRCWKTVWLSFSFHWDPLSIFVDSGTIVEIFFFF